MDNSFWINLASNDLPKAKKFYQAIGFPMNEAHANPGMLSMFVGDSKIVLNLFATSTLQGFSQNTVTDTQKSTEVLFSLGAKSRAEVDALAQKVKAAGGTVYGSPGEKDGWMYGCGFIDPDGHRWNVLFMDMSKMPRRG